VTIMLHVIMNYQNTPLDMNMRATLVWIKMDGEWKLVARQSVKTS
jgi:ketosteroid isomerase-like protein